ncbi:hypothetical protein [Diaphorobacter caeni]|uniref:hypothetical protein n=1 Tax=Diaphorobacter caeni TaxID=2784387 RepID=UPI001E4C8F60|nr:hypothetical protein [Diaphorobacter caeni]
MSTPKPLRRKSPGAFLWLLLGAPWLLTSLSGCTVVSVAGSVVGLAADAAIGTVRIVGKGVGKAADAMLDDDDEKPDNSGITIKYRESREAPLTDQPTRSGASAGAAAPAHAAGSNSPQ